MKSAHFPAAPSSGPHPAPPLDAALPGALRREPEATQAFVKAISPIVLATVRRLLGSQHPDIEDIAQEACLQVLGALPRFRGECGVRHFVVRVSTHCTLAAKRYRHYRDKWTPPLDPEGLQNAAESALPHSPESWQEQFRAEQQRRAIRRLLHELPEQQAEAVVLYFIMGFTAEEVARATNTGARTVRSRLRRARLALRKIIETSPEYARIRPERKHGR